ncbi:MAG: MMPL family transporter, partial [Cytophagales bacterium]|nr:MMPL family transporter [Cytophaga sp.]
GMEDSLIAGAEHFVTHLNSKTKHTNLISDIRYKVEGEKLAGIYDLLYNNLPSYLTEDDYKRIDSITSESGVKESLESDYRKLISPASMVLKQFLLKDPLSISSSALNKLQGLQAEDSYVLHEGYIFRKDKKTIVLFITPSHPPNETKINGPLIDAINASKHETATVGIHIDYFGAAAVAVSNARQIEKDIKVIATLALVFILVFLYWFYRSWLLPLLMISPIAFGALFALSVIYFLQGTISAIAIGAGAVIIGIGLDYSFHVFAHYQHTKSIKEVVNDIATPMLIGSVSTVGAFFSLLYVHSDILSDFGLFAGLCLIGASTFSLIFLPQLIDHAHTGKNTQLAKERTSESVIIKFISFNPEKNKWIVGIVIILTGIFIFYSNRVTFDSDLSEINYMSKDLKSAEDKLYQNDTASGKTIFMLFKGATLTEALSQNEKALQIIDSLQTEDVVKRYAGISGLLPSDSVQQQRIQYWNNYWTPEKVSQVKQYINTYSTELGFKPEAFNEFYQMLDKKHMLMNKADTDFMKQVFLKEYIQEDSNGVVVIASMRLPGKISNEVYKPFERITGLTILDRQLFYNKFLVIVKDDFNQILLSSSLLVFIILLISYGRLELSLISFLPMLISWFWILGLMGIFNIHFNIVNIIISTFVFGLGDDYSIFFTDGLQKKYAEGKDNLPSYKVSVFLSAFTTIVAMGALIFAKHPALKSIALISIIGIACVVVISYTLIPLLFKWIITDRTKKGLAPLTFVSLLFTLLLYIYAVMLLLFVGVTGLILLAINKFAHSKRIVLWYHVIIMYASRSFVYLMIIIKKKIIRPSGNIFNRSFIIISNYQSLLDIPVLLMLHPKIVFIQDDKSEYPFIIKILGRVIQLLYTGKDFTSIDFIRDRLENGYSVLMFPDNIYSEETINYTFVEKALYRQYDLNVFVLPVIIQGSDLCIRKGDFVFNRTDVYIEILPIIHPGQYGRDSFEHTDNVIRNLIKHHATQSFAASFNYYRILSSYIYKGPVLEWYFRVKVGLEQCYQQFDTLIPKSGKIYDLGCGYGFLDYFLSLASSDRTIIGVDYDQDKIAVANHSYLKNERLSFYDNDVMNVSVEGADAVVILDVLHYLPEHSQDALIRTSFEGLNTGGVLIIRDGDSSKTSRHNGTKLTEFFSTKLLMFNKQTEKELCFISSEKIVKVLKDFNPEVKIIDTTRYTSNTIYYIVKR